MLTCGSANFRKYLGRKVGTLGNEIRILPHRMVEVRLQGINFELNTMVPEKKKMRRRTSQYRQVEIVASGTMFMRVPILHDILKTVLQHIASGLEFGTSTRVPLRARMFR